VVQLAAEDMEARSADAVAAMKQALEVAGTNDPAAALAQRVIAETDALAAGEDAKSLGLGAAKKQKLVEDLGRIPCPRAVLGLARFLQDGDVRVAAAAGTARVITNYTSPEPSDIQRFQRDWDVLAAATAALNMLGDASSAAATSRLDPGGQLSATAAEWVKARNAEMAQRQAAVEAARPEKIKRLDPCLPRAPQAKPAVPRKVLIYTRGGMDLHRPGIEMGMVAYELLGARTGAYESTVSDLPTMLDAHNLGKFDAVVFPGDTVEFGYPILADQRWKNLEAFVRGGKGLVGMHGMAVEVTGGGYWGHPWELIPSYAVGYPLKVEDPRSPLCKAFDRDLFILPYAEELYQYYAFSRKQSHVLVSVDLKREMDYGSSKDHDYPMAWVRRFGEGRVFYCGLGHAPGAYESPVLLRFFLDGAQYAIGDLKADDAPSGPLTATAPANDPPLSAQAEGDETGFVSLFNGKDLTGWEGDGQHWSIAEGALVVQGTKDKPLAGDASLTWKGGKVKDFELRLRFRIPLMSQIGSTSRELPYGSAGIGFRSVAAGISHVDLAHSPPEELITVTLGRLYYGSQGQIRMGQKVTIAADGKPAWTGFLGNPNELIKLYRPRDWNDYTILAKARHVTVKLNGVPVSEVEDNDPGRTVEGPLVLLMRRSSQPVEVQFRGIRMKELTH
jgi:type 1 glutamine amidotransferase